MFIITKSIFFLAYSAYYCIWQLRELMLQEYLRIEERAGLFGAVVAIATFLGALFWGQIADRTKISCKKLLIFTSILGCMNFLGLWQVVKLPEVAKLYLSLVLFFLFSFFVGAFQPIVDVVVLQMLQDPSRYGKEKLWGSIAQGAIAIVVKSLTGKIGWISVFPLMASIHVCFIAVVWIWVPSSLKAAGTQNHQEKDFSLRVLFENANFRFLLSIALLLGVIRGIFTVFLSGFHKNILKISSTSLIVAIQCGIALEIACFWWGKTISKRLNPNLSFLIACFFHVFRILLYLVAVALVGIASSGGAIGQSKIAFSALRQRIFEFATPLVELLKGPSYAFMHIPAMMILKQEIPPEAQATAQAIYTGTFNNLSGLISSCLGELFRFIQLKAATKSSQEQRQLQVAKHLFQISLLLSFLGVAFVGWRMMKPAFKARFGKNSQSDTPNEELLLEVEMSKDEFEKEAQK